MRERIITTAQDLETNLPSFAEFRTPLRGLPIDLEKALGIQEALGEDPRLIALQRESAATNLDTQQSITLFRNVTIPTHDSNYRPSLKRMQDTVVVGQMRENPGITLTYVWHREESNYQAEPQPEFDVQTGKLVVKQAVEPAPFRESTDPFYGPRLLIACYNAYDLGDALALGESSLHNAATTITDEGLRQEDVKNMQRVPKPLRGFVYELYSLDARIKRNLQAPRGKSVFINPETPPYMGFDGRYGAYIKIFKRQTEWHITQDHDSPYQKDEATAIQRIREELEQALAA